MRTTLPRCVQVLAAGAVLAGCVSVDVGHDGGATAQYRLSAPTAAVSAATAAPAAKPLARELVIAPVAGSSIDDSFSLAFARNPPSRAPYQFATWSERPSTQLAQQLVDRLAARRSFASVALLGRGIGGDLQLNLVVVDFFHDVAAGAAQVRVHVELVDRLSRRLIARQSFTATATVPQANAAGAAAGLSAAANQVLDGVVTWLETSAAAAPGPAARPPA